MAPSAATRPRAQTACAGIPCRAKIVLAEDDHDLCGVLRYNMEREGYRVVACGDGEEALCAARKGEPDLLILDLMLPKLDGLEVCRRLRMHSLLPILMLTAKGEESDRVLGLKLGADDYVVKPFSMRELLARVEALLRRAPGSYIACRRVGSLELDFLRHEVRLDGEHVELTPSEFLLLKMFIEADGRTLSRAHILDKGWGYDASIKVHTRTVDQHIARLRDKLGIESARLLTVKNVGYRLKTD